MRLDLFLKISRLAKRRTQARELCEGGRVLINGRPAKPAREVNPGDVLTLHFLSRTVEVDVVGTPVPGRKQCADEIYRVKSEIRAFGNGENWTRNQSSP